MYLEVNDLCKSYGEGGSYTQVLKNVSLEVPQGDMCVIQGTSGSGKSTLLNCIGGLDTVDSGSIVVNGKEIVGLNAKQLSDYRREELSFPPSCTPSSTQACWRATCSSTWCWCAGSTA